ncbi:hypothetical protein [Leptotrichia trevisanii]|uniref:hypothetical protein n=1 Tax=Leptotrichia trevisanii TaxID=109328 RepID=UPI0003F6B8FE|nr:hypothetical protein [Leptotrichia trevisanii]
MKKIALGLFMMTAIAAFSAPKYVDVNRIRKDGYTIYQDINTTFAFTKETDELKVAITLYFSDKGSAKAVKNIFKRVAPSNLRLLDEMENSRAYIQKFYESSSKKYMYNIIAKREKVKGCFVTAMLTVNGEISEKKLGRITDTVITDVERYLEK